MELKDIVYAMEKVGFVNFNFDSDKEREGFTKIAQGAIDASMLAQATGLSPRVDPSLSNMPPLETAVEAQPAPTAVSGAASSIPQISPQMAAVGEGITNKDIESLMKIMNILTSMKSEYDAMKKDQMALLTKQVQGGAPVEV